jgi:hypothetical protein
MHLTTGLLRKPLNRNAAAVRTENGCFDRLLQIVHGCPNAPPTRILQEWARQLHLIVALMTRLDLRMRYLIILPFEKQSIANRGHYIPHSIFLEEPDELFSYV